MIYTLVPPEEINRVWLKMVHHVRSLVTESDGRISEMAVYEEVMTQRKLLWIATTNDLDVSGFITTCINDYAKIRMASLEYCAGEDSDLWFIELLEVIERWAKELKCDGIEMVCGRRGWTRKFKEAGFKDKFTWAEKRFHKEDKHGQVE